MIYCRALSGLLGLALIGLCLQPGFADDWPQWRGPTADSVWAEDGVLDKLPEGQIPLRWKVPIGPGYSAPTVADGKVLVTDRGLDPEQEFERIVCLDESNGTVLWVVQYKAPYSIGYKAGPRAAVTIDDGRCYAVGAMGHFHCLDLATGKVIWKHDLNTEYQIRMPIWGIAASPVLYKQLVIQQVGGSAGACMVAFDQDTGKEVWRSLDDRAQYATPVLTRQAGRDVLICWTGDSVTTLDPATGESLARFEFTPINMPIGVASPFLADGRVFVSSFYDGSLMLKLPEDRVALEAVWQRRGQSEQETDALHCMISGPVVRGDHIYGVDSYGELRCLDAKTGDRIWEDDTAVPRGRWSTIHMVQQGDRYWMFNERGELVICKLDPNGFHEISRAQLIQPTKRQLNRRGGVCWAHPAYANRHVFARSDDYLVSASLASNP